MRHGRRQPRDQALAEFGTLHAARAREVEEWFIGAGFFHPFRMNNAACDHGLSSASFGYGEHSWLFTVLCLHAQQDLLPTLDGLRWLNEDARGPFALRHWPDQLSRIIYSEIVSADLDRWAREIAALAAVRRRFGELRRETQGLFELDALEAVTTGVVDLTPCEERRNNSGPVSVELVDGGHVVFGRRPRKLSPHA